VAHTRAWICALVAIAMTFASITSAWATTGVFMRVTALQPSAGSHGLDMSDCERMFKANPTDHHDSNGKGSCADEFCMAKCFKIFGGLQSRPSAVKVSNATQPLRLDRPAIWVDQPPAAPPRS
jgi:hypothetical protein